MNPAHEIDGLVIIGSGGTLAKVRWDSEQRVYTTKDVTDHAYSYLFEPCRLEPAVTLKDIFHLLKRHMDLYQAILRYWVDEIVDEGLSSPPANHKESQVEYLELYWGITKGDTGVNGNLFPSLHGKGFAAEEDGEIEHVPVKAGERINYAIDLTPAYELAPMVVEINEKFVIYEDFDKIFEVNTVIPTLGQVLYGIVWELSFAGSPAERNEFRKTLLERLDEVKRGVADTYDFFEEDSDGED